MLSASYGNWLGDINVSTIGYNRNIFGGTGGANLYYVSLNDLELRLDRPTAEPLANYSANAVAFAGRFSRATNFGTINGSVKYISMQLYDESSNGVAVDLD